MDMKTGSVGSQGIRYACIYNDIDILRLFLEKGAKISQSSGFILAAVCDEHNYNRKLVHELVNVPTNSRNSKNLNEDESVNEKNLEIGSCNVKPPGNTLSFNKIFKFLLERLTISRRQAMIFMQYPELRSFSLDDNEFTGWHIIYCLRRPTGDLTQLVQNKLFELLYYIDYNRLHPHSYLHNQQQQCTNLETVKKDKTSNDSVTRNLAINCMILSDWDYEITNSQMANKYLGMVQLLIDNGLDTNAGHHVVLRTAYKLGDIKWIKHFIKNGARLGKERYAGLNEACQSDNIVVLEQWFENGGVVPKNPKYNGVQIACGLGNFEMLKLLIEKGAELDNPEYNGVKEACELNHVEILNYLIENNATIGRFRNYQLDNAVMVGDIELVRMILEYYTSIDVLVQTQPADLVGKSGSILSLTQTLENNSQYYEHVKTILKNGYIIEPRHLAECLWMAVALRRDEIAKVLCEYSFKPHNETDSTNPNIALGDISRINLAQYYDGFETKKRDLLTEAIKSDNIPLTKLLLLNNFKVENDPHELVQHLNGRNLEMIKLLLEYRPNLSKDPALLYRAVGTDSIEAVGFLLQRYGVV
ncbi:putative ankyrin repeat protein L25, partial [Zancudomyces culisetae]